MTVFYHVFKLLMKGALRLYFKKIKVEGLENIPVDKPLLVTPNHQNAILDALLVGVFLPVKPYFLTRSDVFTKWSMPILKLLHTIPIYRIRDGYSKLSLNNEIFDQCQRIFSSNRSILIFPEGNHGPEYYLRPLTKGAARLALQSQSRINQPLMILPVGLNYFDHQRSGSTVIIRIEKAISVNDYLASYEKHPGRGLIQMRDAIANGMRRSLIIPDETDDYQIQKEWVFQQKHERLSFDVLKSLSVSENEVLKPHVQKKHILAKCLNPLPFAIIYFVISKIDDKVFHASLKFVIALVLFPIWWLLIVIAFSSLFSFQIALLIVAVMISGFIFNYQ